MTLTHTRSGACLGRAAGLKPNITARKRLMLLSRLALAAFFLLAPALARPADAQGAKDFGAELAVKVVNKSTPELCAERDNVELDFVSPQVRHMEVQAVHPAFIGMIGKDRWAPDFSACNMPHSEGALPRKTFYESPTLWLTGLTDPNFWRPTDIPVKVGDRVEKGFAYIQLWLLYRERAEEVLVLYPADGNWRVRPLPYGDMRWTAYGSSFQIGPLEIQNSPAGPRPVVAIKDIAFDPAAKAFTLNFARGGSAKVTLKQVDQDHIALDGRLFRRHARQPAVRRFALDVHDRDQCRRRPDRLAREGRQGLERDPGHELSRRFRHRTLGRARRALAP